MGLSIIRLLLIDDDDDDHILFNEAVRCMGRKVDCKYAYSAAEGLKMLEMPEHELPQIIFLDLNMPFTSGNQCLQRIRSQANLNQISVVVYSTSLDERMANILYNNGANYYVCKPNDFTDIKKVLGQIIDFIEQGKPKSDSFHNFILNP